MTLDYATPAPRRFLTVDGRLVVILMVAAALRLAWVAQLPADDSSLSRLPDQREYLELGANLGDGRGLFFVDPRFADTVYAYRTPGYPLLVALCGAEVRLIRVVQALIDTSSVLAVFLLARRWLSRGLALFCAVLIAVNPFLIYFCGLILTESLFASMLAWGMVLLVMRRRADLRMPPRWGLAWGFGAVLLAASVLVRPSAIALPLLLGVTAAFVNRDYRLPYDWRWSPPVATLCLAVTVLALLPWAWRNSRVVGAWLWSTTNTGITLYDGLNPDATGASDQRFVRSMPQLRSMNETQRSEYLGDLAWRFVRRQPLRAVELAGMKIARLWSPIPLSSDYGTDRRLVAIALAYMVPLYALIVLGLWLAPASRSIKMYLLAPAIYFTIAHAITIGSLRYRVPSDLPMAVIAGLGAGALLARKQQAEAPGTATATGTET